MLDEYLAHGGAARAERERATEAGEAPDFVPLMRAWGGVTIVNPFASPPHKLLDDLRG